MALFSGIIEKFALKMQMIVSTYKKDIVENHKIFET